MLRATLEEISREACIRSRSRDTLQGEGFRTAGLYGWKTGDIQTEMGNTQVYGGPCI